MNTSRRCCYRKVWTIWYEVYWYYNYFRDIRMTMNTRRCLIEMCLTTDTTYIDIYSLYFRDFFRSFIFFPHTYRYHTPVPPKVGIYPQSRFPCCVSPRGWLSKPRLFIILCFVLIHQALPSSFVVRSCSCTFDSNRAVYFCTPCLFSFHSRATVVIISDCRQRSLCTDKQPMPQNGWILQPLLLLHFIIRSLGKMMLHSWHNSLWSIDRQTAQI